MYTYEGCLYACLSYRSNTANVHSMAKLELITPNLLWCCSFCSYLHSSILSLSLLVCVYVLWDLFCWMFDCLFRVSVHNFCLRFKWDWDAEFQRRAFGMQGVLWWKTWLCRSFAQAKWNNFMSSVCYRHRVLLIVLHPFYLYILYHQLSFFCLCISLVYSLPQPLTAFAVSVIKSAQSIFTSRSMRWTRM